MDRAKRIAKTILLVLMRFIEIELRTYVFLIHPLIFVIVALVVALILAAFKGPQSKSTYEERIGDWCKCLIMDFIDWYEAVQNWVEEKLERLNIE